MIPPKAFSIDRIQYLMKGVYIFQSSLEVKIKVIKFKVLIRHPNSSLFKRFQYDCYQRIQKGNLLNYRSNQPYPKEELGI